MVFLHQKMISRCFSFLFIQNTPSSTEKSLMHLCTWICGQIQTIPIKFFRSKSSRKNAWIFFVSNLQFLDTYWCSFKNFFCLLFQNTPPASEKALYESTVVWADSDDPDQAYSVLGSLCEAGVENTNPCDFIARAFFILSGTCKYMLLLISY